MSKLQEMYEDFFNIKKPVDMKVLYLFTSLLGEAQRLQAEKEQQQDRIKRQNNLIVKGEQRMSESQQKEEDFKKTASLYYKEMMEHKQKVERLEKVLNHIHTVTQGEYYQQALIQVDSEYAYALLQIESDAKQALKMEG